MIMTWDISSVDGGTLVEITADEVPDGISADDHAAGMASSLANLALHLSRRPGCDFELPRPKEWATSCPHGRCRSPRQRRARTVVSDTTVSVTVFIDALVLQEW